MLSVETLMKQELVTAGSETSVADAARRMHEARVGALLLLEGDQLAAIFTERDLLTKVIAEGKDPASTTVGSVATRPVASVERNASLRQCAEILREQGVRHVPVVDGEKPVGILSARDFFEAVAGGLERVIEHARYDEALRENADPYDHLGGGYGR